MATDEVLFQRRFLHWLRRAHAWIGLWGAALGFLFGATGILLNHRHTLQLPLAQMEVSQFELAVGEVHLPDANGLAMWLQQQLAITQAPYKIVTEPSKAIIWNGKSVRQPELWKVDFHNPGHSVAAEYWVGNHFVSIKRQDANAFAFLTRLHKGVGMNVGWILLVDSLGGALMVLSFTGILLWTEMRRSRLVFVGLTGISLLLGVVFTLQSI